jgi:hypothetical protein
MTRPVPYLSAMLPRKGEAAPQRRFCSANPKPKNSRLRPTGGERQDQGAAGDSKPETALDGHEAFLERPKVVRMIVGTRCGDKPHRQGPPMPGRHDPPALAPQIRHAALPNRGKTIKEAA